MTVAARSTRLETILIASLALAWLAALAWCRPLLLPDEGRYVGVAWEMLRSGDWLTPTLNGLPYFHKPPLFYWITAGAMAIFGPHEWAVRAAPLLGAWVGAMSVFVFLRRWWGGASAQTALIALLAQPLFYVGGQFANLDMLVAGCITMTTCLLAHCVLSLERGLPYRIWLAAAYASAALGVLAKGLIGFVIPAIVIGSWLIAMRQWRAIGRLAWLPSVLLGGLLVAPWFLAMQSRFPSFLDYFFMEQHFRRFSAGGFNNVQPFWFYPAVLFAGTLPWLPWLRPQFVRGRLTDAERGPVRLLLLIWVIAVVLFFSIPRSKLLGYILPVMAPLAILFADGFETQRAWADGRAQKQWRLSLAVSVFLGVATIVALSMYPHKSTKELAKALLERRVQGEPVFMLNNYYFDLAVYARMKEPAVVVDDWAPEQVRQDSWRKELVDAGLFASERASSVLIHSAQLPAALCAGPVSWVVGPADAPERFQFLKIIQPVLTVRGTALWRLDVANLKKPGALNCAKTPSAD